MAKVGYERIGSAAVLTITRPERRNAVDDETAAELLAGFHRFEADDEARALVLTGEGPEAFCAGADLKAFAERAQGFLEAHPDGGPEELREAAIAEWLDDRPDGPLGFTRLRASKPTIAAISGWCLAGGLELALWCDLRVATESARLGFTERRFGVPLIDGGTQRLPRIVGIGRALELILTGRVVEAAEALDWGMVTEVVAPRPPPRARARDRRGPRGLPPGDDALRSPRGDRGDRDDLRRGPGARGTPGARLGDHRRRRRGALRRRRGPRRRRGRRLTLGAR